MSNISLRDFLDYLNLVDSSTLNEESIHKYLKTLKLTLDEITPYIYFCEKTYGRNLIARNNHFELLALTWLPKQKTPIHDHTGQKSWIYIVTGKLTLQYYQPSDSSSELTPCGSEKVYSNSTWNCIDDNFGVHSITNSSDKPAVSLHLYIRPIKSCRTYSEELRQFHLVEMKDIKIPQSLH